MIRTILKQFSALMLAVTATALFAHSAHAAFDPGNIIDDSVFNNKNAMSVQDIQNFLVSKVPACDSYHTPDARYSQGAQPPWTCLKDYNEGGRSGAQIIYDAGQQYNINPRVLLVTLQKENGLITDTWPYPWQYRTAMGFGCPDDGSCDPNYYGFTKQVQQAARHFRNFFDQTPGWTIPYRPGVRFIAYSPNSNCGGTNVNIQNRATAALYSYTPYQPNAAALNNMFGTGDGCSAYGNRNFWRDYTLWFGSTYGEVNESNISWNFENLEGAAGTQVSTYGGRVGSTPKAIQFGTNLEVFYYDATQGDLRRSYSDSGGWHFQTLDGSGGASGRLNANVGIQATATVYQNALHVFYYDITSGDLRHAWTADDVNWNFETLDGSAGSLGGYDVDLGDRPTVTVFDTTMQLFYHDKAHGNLRHAWYIPGLGWRFENLDGDPGAIGHKDANLGDTSTVTTIGTSLQLYYYDDTNGNLRHAWTDASGWRFENLDGDPGAIGHKDANLGLNPAVTALGSNIQLYYYDSTNGNLRHAWTGTNGWNFENLDGDTGSIGRKNADLGLMPTVTTANGNIYVFYYVVGSNDLRSAYTDATGWHFGTLDGSYGSIANVLDVDLGYDPTVIPFSGGLQLFYYDHTDGNLRHAWGVLP
jgi:hypothetical protein